MSRNEYFAALEQASSGDLNVTAWLDYFAREVDAAAKASELVIGKVLDKARFWMAHGAKPINERQRKVVNMLLDRGRGGFEGGMTNSKYVNITGSSPATAQRDLSELVNTGVLALVGAGRGARYDVQWDAQELDTTFENDAPSL